MFKGIMTALLIGFTTFGTAGCITVYDDAPQGGFRRGPPPQQGFFVQPSRDGHGAGSCPAPQGGGTARYNAYGEPVSYCVTLCQESLSPSCRAYLGQNGIPITGTRMERRP